MKKGSNTTKRETAATAAATKDVMLKTIYSRRSMSEI